MPEMPSILVRYRSLVLQNRPLTKEIESLKTKVRDTLVLMGNFKGVYLSKGKPAIVVDKDQAKALLDDYLTNKRISQKVYDSFFNMVLDTDKVHEAIRKGVINKQHAWAPKNPEEELEPIDGIIPRRVVYKEKPTPKIMVTDLAKVGKK